eukprot:m.9960 g.9960  ORF g.9960 m.9960 type:complete len:423 (-) comp5101_c0_seq1:2673-3941(-)
MSNQMVSMKNYKCGKPRKYKTWKDTSDGGENKIGKINRRNQQTDKQTTPSSPPTTPTLTRKHGYQTIRICRFPVAKAVDQSLLLSLLFLLDQEHEDVAQRDHTDRLLGVVNHVDGVSEVALDLRQHLAERAGVLAHEGLRPPRLDHIGEIDVRVLEQHVAGFLCADAAGHCAMLVDDCHRRDDIQRHHLHRLAVCVAGAHGEDGARLFPAKLLQRLVDDALNVLPLLVDGRGTKICDHPHQRGLRHNVHNVVCGLGVDADALAVALGDCADGVVERVVLAQRRKGHDAVNVQLVQPQLGRRGLCDGHGLLCLRNLARLLMQEIGQRDDVDHAGVLVCPGRSHGHVVALQRHGEEAVLGQEGARLLDGVVLHHRDDLAVRRRRGIAKLHPLEDRVEKAGSLSNRQGKVPRVVHVAVVVCRCVS